MAHADGEQGLSEWRHRHWRDDRKAAQGDFSTQSYWDQIQSVELGPDWFGFWFIYSCTIFTAQIIPKSLWFTVMMIRGRHELDAIMPYRQELWALMCCLDKPIYCTPHLSVLTCLVSLSQDYQEEISVSQENKQQLQVMGERLARASQDSKAAEIQHKLSKVSERWQHLLDLIAARWVYKTLKNRWRVSFDSRVWVGSVKVERKTFQATPKSWEDINSNIFCIIPQSASEIWFKQIRVMKRKSIIAMIIDNVSCMDTRTWSNI